MADAKMELRDPNVRQLPPWTEIFRGFGVALDPKKLLLAAAGLLAMALLWCFWSIVFFNSRSKPAFGSDTNQDWATVKQNREQWNLLYRAAGSDVELTDPTDLADTRAEYDQVQPAWDEIPQATKEDVRLGRLDPQTLRPRVVPIQVRESRSDGTLTDKTKTVFVRRKLPCGEMRTLPWFEDRGPNPYLLVTGQEGNPQAAGAARFGPWEQGQFVSWFLGDEVPVLIEPLRKFLLPVIFLLHPKAGFLNCLYFALVLVSTLVVWALFGGAITRMAVVQVARKEKIGMREALRFALSRYLSFLSAPLFPLVAVLVVVLLCIVFGFLHLFPWFGDIVVDGLGWPLILLAGIVMAFLLVGLVGWPLMYATISAEGSDSFDALSRSYSYVYQCPWHYIWYSVVAIAYGAVVVFFVGFMGSLMVYLGKWAVSQTPFVRTARWDRDPSYLFVYTPTSFGWRDLLLQGATVGGQDVVQHGVVNQEAYGQYVDQMGWNKRIGAVMVSVWLYLVFLMIVGFGYSYFWSASTIIYLLMRRRVDDTDLDEIYLEEDEGEDAYRAPAAPVSASAPAGSGSPAGHAPLTMVEPPTLKTPAPPAAPPPAAPKVETLQPGPGDSNPPA